MGRISIRFLLLLMAMRTQVDADYIDQNIGSLEGKHLTVIMENFPPSTIILRNSSGHVIGYSGAFVAQFDWLSKRLGFEYTMMPWDNSILRPIKSNKTRNTFGEMIGQLIQKEVDVSLGPFVIRLERQDIGIGGLMGGMVNGMLIRYPASIEKSIYATVEPFSYQIWIGIVISFFLLSGCSCLIIFISRRTCKEISNNKTNAKMVVYFFKLIVQQGTNYIRVTRSMGVLAFTWSLIAIVIVNAYNSSVISYLSTNYRKPEVSTFKKLAENPNYNILNVKGTAGEYDVKTGVSEVLKTLAKQYERCPDCSIEYNPERIANKVMNEKYVAVLTVLQTLAIINQFSPDPRRCTLSMGNDQLRYYHTFFGVHRESPYQVQLRQESLWYISHGFQLYFDSSREAIGTGQCLLKYNYKGGQSEKIISPIKLKQLFVPFVILICGWILAFFQFLRELMHAHCKNQVINKFNSGSAVTTKVVIESPPAAVDLNVTSHHLAEAIKDKVETNVTIESPLKVIDISED